MDDAWIRRSLELLDSYQRWLGGDLVDRGGDPARQAQRLYESPIVVVAHNRAADPLLDYANLAAVALWETRLESLLSMPSRLTAEPLHRAEREQMLRRTARDGYIGDYRGIRITASGRRFQIERAVVWNVLDADEAPAGQAAAFTDWTWL